MCLGGPGALPRPNLSAEASHPQGQDWCRGHARGWRRDGRLCQPRLHTCSVGPRGRRAGVTHPRGAPRPGDAPWSGVCRMGIPRCVWARGCRNPNSATQTGVGCGTGAENQWMHRWQVHPARRASASPRGSSIPPSRSCPSIRHRRPAANCRQCSQHGGLCNVGKAFGWRRLRSASSHHRCPLGLVGASSREGRRALTDRARLAGVPCERVDRHRGQCGARDQVASSPALDNSRSRPHPVSPRDPFLIPRGGVAARH